MRHVKGFTLIELMVVVVIIAILASIAIPNYTQYIQRARRTEAMSTLLAVSAAMEKFLLSNNAYPASIDVLVNGDGGTLTGVGAGLTTDGTNFFSENANYVVTRDTASETAATGWVLLAAATSNAAQADSDCFNFRITQRGVRSVTDSGGAPTTATCWPN